MDIVNRVKLSRVVFTGEDDEVQLDLQMRDEAGQWVPQDYADRTFVREVFDDAGVVLASVNGVVVGYPLGSYLSFVFPADSLIGLLRPGEEARDLRHAIHEVLDSGRRGVTGPDPFLLRRGAHHS